MDGIVTTIVDYPLSVHRGPVESLVPVKSIFYVSNQGGKGLPERGNEGRFFRVIACEICGLKV